MNAEKIEDYIKKATFYVSIVFITVSSIFVYNVATTDRSYTENATMVEYKKEVLSYIDEEQTVNKLAGIINYDKPKQECEDDPELYVAVVNCFGVSRELYSKRLAQKLNFYKYSNNLTIIDNDRVKEEVLEELLSQAKAEVFLVNSGHEITFEEVQAYIDRLVGGGSKEAYFKKIYEIYGADKSEHINWIVFDLEKEQVQKLTGLPFNTWVNDPNTDIELSVKVIR